MSTPNREVVEPQNRSQGPHLQNIKYFRSWPLLLTLLLLGLVTNWHFTWMSIPYTILYLQ